MITVATGKTGSGKTTFALIQIARELVHGKRVVVTNVAIHLQKFAAYLREAFNYELDPERLVQLDMDDERLCHYWRIRGHGVELGPFGGPDWKEVLWGVFYVLDEIQKPFPMSKTMEYFDECRQYGARNRHFGDDTIGITPHPSLIGKPFRILCTECVILDNWYHKKIKWFRAPKKIVWHSYSDCPPSQGDVGGASGHFYIEPEGISGCFNTAAGAGQVAQQADIGRVQKGLSVYALAPILLGLGLVLYLGLRGGTHHMLNKGQHLVADQLGQPGTGLVKGKAGVPAMLGAVGVPAVAAVVPERKQPPMRRAVGWGRVAKEVWVEFEDGGIRRGSSLAFWPEGVVCDGEIIRLVARTPVLQHTGPSAQGQMLPVQH